MFRKIKILVLFVLLYLPGMSQVTLQTGSAVFSLPMFNWQDDKSRLTSVVALSYNSGNGLKVNDVASNEGQGWNLIAGGVITRMQIGEPDDQIAYPASEGTGTPSDQDLTKYPAGYLYGDQAPAVGCNTALTTYPTYGAKNVLYKRQNSVAQDRQPDYFAFQFNGKSGQFLVSQVGGDHGVLIGDSKIKITFQRDPTMTSQGIRTTITSFTIQDVDGLIYKFTQHGLTKLLNSTYSNVDGTQPAVQPKIGDIKVFFQSAFDQGPSAPVGGQWKNSYMANPFIISSWYLTEIDDPLVSRKILFTYNTLNLNNSAGIDIAYNSGSNRFITISYKKSITTTLEPASIVYPDGHQVNFNYGTTQRIDFPGEYPMTSVNITYQGRYLSQYQLNTSYLILDRYGNPTSAYEKNAARLYLRSVKKIGVDLKEDTPPYIFDYYKGSGVGDDFVPPPFFYAKDVWGYYNGNNSVGYSGAAIDLTTVNAYNLPFDQLRGLCFQNQSITTGISYNAKPGFAQNGLLKSIIYPTGGSLVYQYTQNTGSFMGNPTVLNIGGVHVSQTSSTDGGYSNGCATPVTTQYNYVMNGVGSASSLWGAEQPTTTITANNFWKEEQKTIHFDASHFFGECLWHFVYPGILSINETTSLDMFQKVMAVLSPVLGVMSIVSDVMTIVHFADATPWAIVGVILDIISTVFTYIISCPQATKNSYATIYYNFDLNASSPLPTQFKRVEITESPGTIGKTVELFTNGDPTDTNDDYDLWVGPGLNTALSTKQRFAPWAYGLPKLITQYDVSGNKIKETQNVYNFTYAQEAIFDLVSGVACGKDGVYAELYSCRCMVINSYAKRSDHWDNDIHTYTTTPISPDMLVDISNFYSGRVTLDVTYERIYRTTDVTKFVQSETDYTYNIGNCDNGPGNYDVRTIVTKQSNGDVNYKNISYSVDYNTGVLATMVQNRMFSVPVATNSYVIKAGTGTLQYLNEKVTEFVQLSNNDIKPTRILEQRFATPNTSFIAYSGPTTTNYTIYKIPQQFSYDLYGNLNGLQDEGGRTVYNIYDYNDKYIVASVINAKAFVDQSAYTSFESQDLSRSGWQLTGSPVYVANPLSPTGASVFTLSPSGANFLTGGNLNTTKPYVLSFWASSGNVTVTGGATLQKSAPTYNGFTYYEYAIAQGTTSVVVKNTSASSVNIDELRLYPSSARMRTTTYDPLIGKTSESDENNRITYYVYDNLGRMRFIEDEARNIVKMYEYNNVSAAKQNGCPGSYSNPALTELIRKSNCGAGYQGSDVSFTVPAGRYSSTVSQFDADIQAEIDLFTNGQTYANTNGSCALIYYNVLESETDITQNCAVGYVGGPVTYTVPAGIYSSIISQADANQQALDDVAANGIYNSNAPGHTNCAISTTPDWEWFAGDDSLPPDPSYCLSVSGQLPPHLFLQATDVNPNSSTYNQKQWEDSGPSSQCPANTYYNAGQTVAFIKNNCTSGYVGSIVNYVVPPGKYSSTVSQAAADLQATNEVNANGQNNANTTGTCIPLQNVHYVDSRAFQYSVRFTNNATQVVYNFTANANTTGTLGQVPTGTYTVYICPVTNYVANNNYTVQGVSQTNVVCTTFNIVSVSSTANLSFY